MTVREGLTVLYVTSSMYNIQFLCFSDASISVKSNAPEVTITCNMNYGISKHVVVVSHFDNHPLADMLSDRTGLVLQDNSSSRWRLTRIFQWPVISPDMNLIEHVCYSAGVELEKLPCDGCMYCTRAHNQWARFDAEVNDVISLSKKVNVTTVVPEIHQDTAQISKQ